MARRGWGEEFYAKKLSQIAEGETTYLQPMQFVRYCLDRQGLSLQWLSEACGYRPYAFHYQFNGGGGISRNNYGKLEYLTGKPRSFWMQSRYTPEQAEQVTFREGLSAAHIDPPKGSHTERLDREAMDHGSTQPGKSR
ncbi:MAG: hypothetical protein DI582_07020 [Azospirillum brasilense]|nr:MAG: hypothetical protein DI582_07020 [Azospirillum brasilense]